MARRPASPRQAPEPDILRRLRRAVQTSGLTADIASKNASAQAILVTSRVAQTAIDHLQSLNPAAGENLLEELRALADPEAFELVAQGRGYTSFHVVHFLYEFAKHHLSDGHSFCAGVGKAGGGLQIKPETDILSLVRLLITALPADDDRRNVGLLIQTLSPLMLEKVFTTRRFHIEVLPEQQDRLRITLRYADPDRVKAALRSLDLEEYIGTFFLNSALQIQGTIQLGLDIFTQEEENSIEMGALIEDRDRKAQEEIERACSCTWTVTWKPGIRLRRLTDPEEVLAQVRTIYETLHRRDLEYFQERVKTLEMRVQALEEGDQFHDLIGKSPQMRQVYRLIQQVATSDLTVLIRGESGVGKELVARAIHQSSARRERPFVPVNGAAFPEALLESELFGHEKGAFTGADRTKPGRFEMADGGTLFLDEVGDIPLTTQVKLLRVLETKAFERVGGTQTLQTDVRILGATNRDLEGLIAKGQFREDLYFRLNVLPVHLPPLREHREDIPLLAHAFLRKIALRSDKEVRGLSRNAVERLLSHPWPGNIRELQNVLERAVAVYAKGPTLTASDIAQALGVQARRSPAHPLNLRQQRVFEAIHRADTGCTVEDLLGVVASPEHAGESRRTLQNDLRKLSDLGYVTWHKQGSARRYVTTGRT